MFIPLFFLVFLQNIVPSSQQGWPNDDNDHVKLEIHVTGYSKCDSTSTSHFCCSDHNKCENCLGQCLIRFGFDFDYNGRQIYDESEVGYLDKHGKVSGLPRTFWATNFTRSLPMYPYLLRMRPEHTAPIINADGEIDQTDHVTSNETFIIELASEPKLRLPNVHNQQIFTEQVFQGYRSMITMQVSVSCINPELVGEFCDLKCTPSLLDNKLTMCINLRGEGRNLYKYLENGQVKLLGGCHSENAIYCHTELGSLLYSIRGKILVGVLLMMFIIVLIFKLVSALVEKRIFNKNQTPANI